jgi:hypothetical protein
MAVYTSYSQDWLEDSDSIKIILVEATVYNVTSSLTEVLYLSNANYTTTDGSISYSAVITKAVTFTEVLTQDGSGSLTFSDLQITNHNGELDAYLDSTKYIWSNQPIRVYYGDPQWSCANLAAVYAAFNLVFSGVTDDVTASSRISLVLKLRNKMEQLNSALTEDKLGTFGTWSGGQTNQDQVKPVVFGEVFNISPLLIDPSLVKYSWNTGLSEQLIEIRDTGVPLQASVVTNPTISVNTLNGVITGIPTVVTGGTGWVTGDRLYLDNENVGISSQAVFTANPSNSSSLTVTGVSKGTLVAGMLIIGTGIPADTTIVSGPGGVGTYTVNKTLNIVSSGTVTEINYPGIVQVTGTTNGAINTLLVISRGTGYTTGTKQTALWSASVTRTTAVVDNQYGLFCLGRAATGTITCSVQGVKKSVNLSTGALDPTTYVNNIANITAVIVTQYGKANTRLTSADLDLTNLQTFSTDNPQPVGTVVTDTANVITVCKQLANSIAAQVTFTRTGKLRLLRYGTGYNTGAVVTTITESDMLYNSLVPSAKLQVTGAVKIGYAKNYTVQSGLVTDIPQSHRDSMALDWFSNTKINQQVIDRYKLSSDASQEDTQLIVGSDADTEATRRLALRSAQHYTYKFTGTSRLLGLQLGQTVTLTHSRFNLSSGVTAQVIMLAPNWTTGYVDVEVFV